MSDPSLIFTRPIIKGSGRMRNENCSVELLGLAIYGDYRSGINLPCIDFGCQSAVVIAQDRLDDETRNSRRWRLLIARLATCHNTGNERVARRMGLWAARSVEHLNADPRVKACNDALERWLAGDASGDELMAMTKAAEAAWKERVTRAVVEAAADAARCAGESAQDSELVHRAAWASAEAATAIALADEDELVDWVDRYLDAWAKIAADEGCMAPDGQEIEYLDFVSKLDFLTQADTQ